ncbi:S-adenosyl-L-methionine-dependent methyltransferase [Aspergillus californicus]
MEAILSQIRTLAAELDIAGRVALQDVLRKASSELESPHDLMSQLHNGHLRIAAVRLAVSVGIFQALAQSPKPLNVAQLAERSSADPEMLERLVRYLASNGEMEEVGMGKYKANKNTYILSDSMTEAFISHSFDVGGPTFQAFPDFFVETGFKDITSNTNTPFQKAFNTDLPAFVWLAQNPKHLVAMQKTMSAYQSSGWIEGFDLFEKEALDMDRGPEKVIFVDVGGGHGHQCVEVKKKYPDIKGQLVLEDLPEVVAAASELSGVRVVPQDFFQEQSIKGARFYYLRRILHDWPDALCLTILKNLRAAMASDSQLLIDELILPDNNVPWQSAMVDMSMMTMLGGKERTKGQWAKLAEQSGLRIAQIHKYNDFAVFHSVIVMELE